jgi:23S rRNA-/tRNA-specific pseudouridylate synthase
MGQNPSHGYPSLLSLAGRMHSMFAGLFHNVFLHIPEHTYSIEFLLVHSHRTHQLRVHCAAIGHPIVADQTYGYLGEGCENGGLDEYTMNTNYPHRACLESQRRIDSIVREHRKNLCLHASRICLPHPKTGELMTFDSPAPF